MLTTQIAAMPIWSVADAAGHWAVGRVVRSDAGRFVATMNGDGPVAALEDQIGRAVVRLPQADFATLDEAAAYFEQAVT